jgi:CRP-like cAMP-binding protein
MSQQGTLVGAHQFLRGVPARHAERLAEIAEQVSFPADYQIFEEGRPAQKFWLITAGQVALDALVPGRGRVAIERLGRGDLVGLSWLQPPYQWQYGAVTTQPVRALEFDAARVRACCAEDNELGYELLTRVAAVAAQRLHATRARLLDAWAAAA